MNFDELGDANAAHRIALEMSRELAEIKKGGKAMEKLQADATARINSVDQESIKRGMFRDWQLIVIQTILITTEAGKAGDIKFAEMVMTLLKGAYILGAAWQKEQDDIPEAFRDI